MQQRDQNAAARRANRMTERNRAAIDINNIGVPAHFLINCGRLRGEGLIDLHQI